MNFKTAGWVLAWSFITGGAQAIGVTMPATQQTGQAQDMATTQSQQITDLLIDNERLQKALQECMGRCGP